MVRRNHVNLIPLNPVVEFWVVVPFFITTKAVASLPQVVSGFLPTSTVYPFGCRQQYQKLTNTTSIWSISSSYLSSLTLRSVGDDLNFAAPLKIFSSRPQLGVNAVVLNSNSWTVPAK
jgi:hypothetical protein